MVAISNEPGFVMTIMLAVEDKVNSDPFVVLRRSCSPSKIMKGIIILDLVHFQRNGILPEGVASFLIKLKGFGNAVGDFIAILELNRPKNRLELDLVKHTNMNLFACGKALEAFPTRSVKKSIVLGIECTLNRIISGYGSEGLIRCRAGFLFNHNIPLRTFVVQVLRDLDDLRCT